MVTENQPQTAAMRRNVWLVLALALVLVYVLWNVEALSFITYPLRLFVTYIHEAGHSLTAILTGGQVIQFTVSANGSGLATTAGGARALILPAGYLGAAAFGALLFYTVNRFPRVVRPVATGLGLFLVVFTLLYARPDASGAWTAVVIGILFGALLAGMAWKLPAVVNLLVLNVLALMTGLNAVFDVWYLVGNSGAGSGAVVNDAAAFSRDVLPILPGAVWAFMWALLAVLMLGAAVYFSLLHPLRRRAK